MNDSELYNLLLSECPKSEKNIRYLNSYCKYIFRCRTISNLTSYRENHHICPKSLFPEYKDLRKNKWNKISLTAKQHYIAHLFLAKIFGGSMWYALKAMSKFKGLYQDKTAYDFISDSKAYSEIKENIARLQSERMSGSGHHMFGKKHSEESLEKMRAKKRKENNPNYGISTSEETKKLISQRKTGVKREPFSEEWLSNMSKATSKENNPMFGKKHSEESKRRMSETRKLNNQKRKMGLI